MVWTPLHAYLHTLLRQHPYLPPRSRLLLGFSGGQDSLCLLQLLRDLQPKWHWDLAIAHCDHRWPPDSHLNAQHVAQLAQTWQITLHSFLAPKRLKGEAEGRTWRYQVMSDLAQQQGYTHLVTAHTASDRAETLLYNLVRGSGMDGLQALLWQRKLTDIVTLVRPLLATTRAQTQTFCQELNLPIWNDSMNQDYHYRRNRLRLDVLPYLREHFNPQVDRAIAQTAELLQADVEYLEKQAQKLFIAALNPENVRQIDRQKLAEAPLSLQRRTLRLFLNPIPGLNYTKIEQVLQLLYGNHRDRTESLGGGWSAEVFHRWIQLIQ
ncbi:tRNA lysidine(34) synthetase TilS [Lyngbya confervoides]|uniref:tRNA(Ile)-lysidine synthase n=1 Tax=Lyngbya confervoides BDU141951 TaxID=1574623 RepID=A0ABD4T8K5_9CYAN|nr:tRNA lysidine(34) synthetase TilS [Lyngbya confervoides]MCM1984823.1 tRNA lysidine(34) synthetase TilS [Lyngbya confervoides BDU141951]